MSICDRKRRAARGFTLIEIAVVLVIIAIFLSMGAVMFRGIIAAQKRTITGTRLATVDSALMQFVQLNKRLPCPADGTIASTGVNPGVEQWVAGVCTNNQLNGVVPWVTLGISEVDATDGWDRRFTYRVASALAAASGMDMSWCDPAGTEPNGALPRACNSACTNSTLTSCTKTSAFLVNKGLEVRTITGTQVMRAPTDETLPIPAAAAYVVISHGESGGGAYLNTGQLSATTTTDGTEEVKNYANLALQAYYLDDASTDVAGTSHFDDILSRPSILALAAKAGLGPRSH